VYRVDLVPAAQVDAVWPIIGPGMALACRNVESELTPHNLWADCRTGRAFLSVVTDGTQLNAAVVWRFHGETLHCVMVYGSGLLKWAAPLRDFAYRLAKAGGAKRISLDGRKAHQRLFPKARITRITYEEDVDG